MSLLTTLYAQTAALADGADTYVEDAHTNSTGGSLLVTLSVSTTLAVVIVDGTIDTVTFTARGYKTGSGTWVEDRIKFCMDGDAGLSSVVSIPTSLATIGNVDSGAQATASDATPWTWAHLTQTTVRVEVDVTLDPGESAALRVAEVSAAVDGTAAPSAPSTVKGWRAWPSTKVVT